MLLYMNNSLQKGPAELMVQATGVFRTSHQPAFPLLYCGVFSAVVLLGCSTTSGIHAWNSWLDCLAWCVTTRLTELQWCMPGLAVNTTMMYFAVMVTEVLQERMIHVLGGLTYSFDCCNLVCVHLVPIFMWLATNVVDAVNLGSDKKCDSTS